MKKLILLIALVSLTFVSCERGSTSLNLNGTEQGLPPELKGLRVYTVQDGITHVKVALFNGQVNSVTYPVGKTEETTIIINGGGTPRTIECKEIISETDEIIVIRKK
jgi:hypothetical protein